MSVLQIIAICVLGAGTLVALGFLVAFIIISCTKEKTEKYVPVNEEDDEVNEIDLDAMLAKLEEISNKKVEEKKPEPVVEVVEEVSEPIVEEVEPVNEEIVEEVEVVEEAKPMVEEVVEVVEEPQEVEVYEERQEPTTIIINNIPAEKAGPEFDYRIRLEKIKESQAKIDRDLEKTERAILKYERTIRRKERNQKMLDRRALELTNLNLLMYSVTDIKNVDEEKKTRQEELTAHISELKASIQDAENYLEANREKHDSNLKLQEYLSHEKTRYADEVRELEALIASGKFFDDDTTGEE